MILKLAYGPALKLTPDVFWEMSWREFELMVEGTLEAHNQTSNQLTKEEADEIVRQGQALLKKQGKI